MDLQTELPKLLYSHLRRPPREPDGHFHMSQLAAPGDCTRKRIIEMAGLPLKPVRDQSLAVFEFGHMIEKMALDALATLTYHQGRVELKKLNARGSFDCMLLGGDGVSLVDIKSTSGKSFDFVRNRPKENYRMQLTAYAMALGEGGAKWEGQGNVVAGFNLLPTDVDQTAVFYIDKEYGNSFVDEFDWHEYEEKVIGDLKQWAADWEEYQRSKCLPLEVPFIEATRYGKHVKAGRAKPGELVPSGLCSPLYCSSIGHCPEVARWWETHKEKS